MADVKITNTSSDLNGAVLSNAATEATLQRLVNAVNALGGSKKGGKDGNKVQELHNKTIEKGTKVFEDNVDRGKLFGDILKDSGKEAKNFGSSVAGAASSIVGAGLGMVFSGIVLAGKQMLGVFTESLDAFRDTSSVGASFNNDLVLLRKTAAEAAMPLDMFTSTVQKNSQLMSQMGGTVTKGAQAFASMSNELRTSEFGKNMMGMGLTMNDLNDYLGSYLDIQMRTGKLEGKTRQELLTGTQEYVVEMDKLSKITGLSRKEAEAALARSMKEGRTAFMASRLSGDSLKNFQSAVTLVNTKLQPFSDTLTNAMTGIVAPGDKFGSLMASAVPNFLEFNKAMGDGKLGAKEQVIGYRKQADSIKKFLSTVPPQMIASIPEFRKMQEYLGTLNEFTKGNLEDAVKEQEKRDKITTTMGSFEQTIQSIKDKILLALINSNVFDYLKKGLEMLADVFEKIAPKIGPFFETMIGTFDRFISGLVKDLETKSISDIITDAFKSIMKAVGSSIMDGIGDWFKGLFSSKGGAADKKKQSDIDAQLGNISTQKSQINADASMSTEEKNKELRALEDQRARLLDQSKQLTEENKKTNDSFFSFLDIGSNLVTTLGLAAGAFAGLVLGINLLAKPVTMMTLALTALTLAAGFGGEGLGKILSGLGDALTPISDAFLGIATVIKDLALGAFNSINEIIKSMTAGFQTIPVVLGQLAGLDAANIAKVSVSMAALSAALVAMSAGSGIMSLFGKDGLGSFADNASRIAAIDGDAIKNTVNAISSIKNVVGADLSAQADGVKAFTESIKELSNKIKELQASLEKLNKTPGGPEARGAVNAAISSQAAATTTSSDRLDKLNTLMIELVAVTKEVRDFNKDQVDAIRNRGNAMGTR